MLVRSWIILEKKNKFFVRDCLKKFKFDQRTSSNKPKNGSRDPFWKAILFDLALVFDGFFPTAVTHGNVGIVAADEHLTALCDHVSVLVDASVDNGFFSAGADGFDLRDRIGNLKEPAAAREEMSEKIGSQTKTENRDLKLVHDPAQLIDLGAGEELALVGDDHVIASIFLEFGKEIDALRNRTGLRLKTDP